MFAIPMMISTPIQAGGEPLNLGTGTVSVFSAGSGDPCTTSNYLTLRLTWTVVAGTGTVKFEKSSNGSSWTTIETGIPSTALVRNNEYEFYVRNLLSGINQTFWLRVVNEDDASDIASDSITVKVVTCV